MKLILLTLLALKISVSAQEKADDKDLLLDALMNAADLPALNQAILDAKKSGLPEQMLLEARFVFLVNEDDRPALAALAPELEAHLPKFSSDNTMLFAVREDFESIIQYTKALGALEKKDHALFKKHITEAFWLSPSHAAQFAPLINDLRMEEAMKKITLDLNRSFEDQRNQNGKTTLTQALQKSPAVLLHFWSPWVQQSISAMPEIAIVSKTLIENKIPVVSVLIGASPESRKDADAFLQAEGKDQPGHWIVDSEKNALGSTLRISSFPSVALLSPDGKILFNGDPADKRLWAKLAMLNPQIKPPTISPVLPKNGTSPLPEPENGK